jgi:heptaprenyl diphosphate synthase
MRNTKKQIRKLTVLGVLTAAALILSYAESVLPPIFPAVPGIKVGLPNVVIIFVLYRMGIPSAVSVSLARIAVSALLFGSPISFLYSLSGALLSITVMSLLKKTRAFSYIGVSVAGGVLRNVGQILAAMLLLQALEVGYYMTVLAVTGTLAGFFVGLCAAYLIHRLPEIPSAES